MRYLGVDYGRKRMGVALSDPEGRIAFPKRVIALSSGEAGIAEAREIAHATGAEELVVGLPLGLDGQETEESRRARVFAKKLANALKLPIHLENEIFTTRMVQSLGKGKMSDASAAAIILQSYLDRRNREAGIRNDE